MDPHSIQADPDAHRQPRPGRIAGSESANILSDPNFVPTRRSATEGTIRQEVLRLAEQYVSRDRHAVHGKPEDNFATIAKLQYIYAQACIEVRGNATKLPHDVAVDNILQKIARLVQSPYHLDHWVDIAGYSACGAECRPPTPLQREQPENL